MAICPKEIEMKKFKSSFTEILKFGLSMLLISTLGIVSSVQASESEVSVPKGIQDIVNSLNQASAGDRSRDDDLRLINKETPKEAKDEDLYSHFYFQAKAAQKLGRINQRIDFLNKSLQYAKIGTQQEFQAGRHTPD